MTTDPDREFADLLDVEGALLGRFGTEPPDPITPTDIAAEQYATESLVLSAPKDAEEE